MIVSTQLGPSGSVSMHLPSIILSLKSSVVIDGSSNIAARNAVGKVLVNVSMYGVSGVSCAPATPATAVHVPAIAGDIRPTRRRACQ